MSEKRQGPENDFELLKTAQGQIGWNWKVAKGENQIVRIIKGKVRQK